MKQGKGSQSFAKGTTAEKTFRKGFSFLWDLNQESANYFRKGPD